MRHQFVRVPVEHFRKTTRANQRCAEEVVSAVLFGVWVASVDDSLPREDAVTHLTSFVSRLLVLAVDIYSHKIKNLLEPQPEHGWIQFHRLNIKNGSQPEGVIKMTDLLPLAPLSGDPLIPPFSGRLKRQDQTPLSGLERHDQTPPRAPLEHGGIQFHRFNIESDSRLEGLIKMSDPIQISAYCLPNFPLILCCGITMQVKYWSENSKRLIHFSTREVLGRLLEAFSQRITLCDR
uniref:PAS domain-containing protein n=1 Tax=Ananas comosus var. bracteatus TaxID=296719 RepID=A0A6V7Q0M2_ANACO|nr:unnamed protein product [Ananas comosus var. bracteatus]